ncbi:hypothetical protein [Aliiglaciecola litoralis]|uniref:hypothetical protein n=1 Tax=Aliiglaciecola litoralis TaxID=582857 RepID=UPI0031CF5658
MNSVKWLPAITTTGLVLLSCWVHQAIAQELPSNCIALPTRTQVCPNLLYKRAPISVESLNIQEGEAMCICLTDFSSLRVSAADEQGKVDQLVSASRAAAKLNITETELLTLLRK